MNGDFPAVPMSPPPGRPLRELDTACLEGLEDIVAWDTLGRALIKSRDFPELQGLEVQPEDVKVVLFDANSIDSFAACLVARKALGESARYEGVHRSISVEELQVDITGQVVAMLGVCWSLEAMHDLVAECDWLFVLETHVSVMRELEQFAYPHAVLILDTDMSAGPLAWNFFRPGEPVPFLLRALEDAELGRKALRNAAAFADGFQATCRVEPPKGEIHSGDPACEELELLMDAGGQGTIDQAVEEGLALASAIESQCEEAAAQRSVRTLRAFPAWRCALLNLSSPFAGRVAEHLAATLVAEGGEQAEQRIFAMVFEVRMRRIRVTLRSLPGGPDVSEIAQQYAGSGRQNRSFFSVDFDEWEELWLQPEPVLWDTMPLGIHCLALRRGERVVVVRRGERFKDAPFDEWSWGYRSGDHLTEGWIPTFAHTLFVAMHGMPSVGPGIQAVEEGDLLIARGQKGEYLWGCNHRFGHTASGLRGWFPYKDSLWLPVHPTSTAELVRAIALAS